MKHSSMVAVFIVAVSMLIVACRAPVAVKVPSRADPDPLRRAQQRRLAKGVALYEKASRQGFSEAVRYVNLAIAQRRNGHTQEALNNLRRALAIEARHLPAFHEMALLYLMGAEEDEKKLALAEVVCTQALRIDPGFAPIYNAWGLINLRQKDIIGASAKFRKATEFDPKMFEAYMNFARLTLKFRGYRDAHRAFRKALELHPDSFSAQIGLAISLRGLGRKDAAGKAYLRAIEIDGDRAETYFNLGVLYQDYRNGTIEDMTKARQFFLLFLDKAGDDWHYAAAVNEVTRRCAPVSGRRSRSAAKCQAGRLQNIETYLQNAKDLAQPTNEGDKGT